MKSITGTVISTKNSSNLNKKKHALEIELDTQDPYLLNWQNKKVIIKRTKDPKPFLVSV